jgi:hypothetical protein
MVYLYLDQSSTTNKYFIEDKANLEYFTLLKDMSKDSLGQLLLLHE